MEFLRDQRIDVPPSVGTQELGELLGRRAGVDATELADALGRARYGPLSGAPEAAREARHEVKAVRRGLRQALPPGRRLRGMFSAALAARRLIAVEAIVMAAGEGRRLRPVTERWPKPILPVDGRAVIATLIRRLAAEGIGPVTVVTGYLAEQVEGLLAGLDVQFARQPEPHGSADAVRRALEAGAGLPAIVSAADSVFAEGDLARFAEAFSASKAAGAIAYMRQEGPVAIRVEDGLVRTVVEEGPGDLTPAPLWGLTHEIDIGDLPGPPYELAVAFQRAIDSGGAIAAIEIGPTRHLTDPTDLVRENFPYLGMR